MARPAALRFCSAPRTSAGPQGPLQLLAHVEGERQFVETAEQTARQVFCLEGILDLDEVRARWRATRTSPSMPRGSPAPPAADGAAPAPGRFALLGRPRDFRGLFCSGCRHDASLSGAGWAAPLVWRCGRPHDSRRGRSAAVSSWPAAGASRRWGIPLALDVSTWRRRIDPGSLRPSRPIATLSRSRHRFGTMQNGSHGRLDFSLTLQGSVPRCRPLPCRVPHGTPPSGQGHSGQYSSKCACIKASGRRCSTGARSMRCSTLPWARWRWRRSTT